MAFFAIFSVLEMDGKGSQAKQMIPSLFSVISCKCLPGVVSKECLIHSFGTEITNKPLILLHMNKFSFYLIGSFFLSAFLLAGSLQAQGCYKLLRYKKGIVHPAVNAVVKKHSAYDPVRIRIKKTGGMAKGTAKIYIGGQYKGKIDFQNGNTPTSWKVRNYTGARNKEVKVVVDNKSVGFTFNYQLEIRGDQMSLAPFVEEGTLSADFGSVDINYRPCSGRARIRVSQTYPTHTEGRVYIYETGRQSPLVTRSIPRQKGVVQPIIVESDEQLRIRIVNLTDDGPLDYRLSAEAIN